MRREVKVFESGVKRLALPRTETTKLEKSQFISYVVLGVPSSCQ